MARELAGTITLQLSPVAPPCPDFPDRATGPAAALRDAANCRALSAVRAERKAGQKLRHRSGPTSARQKRFEARHRPRRHPRTQHLIHHKDFANLCVRGRGQQSCNCGTGRVKAAPRAHCPRMQVPLPVPWGSNEPARCSPLSLFSPTRGRRRASPTRNHLAFACAAGRHPITATGLRLDFTPSLGGCAWLLESESALHATLTKGIGQPARHT